MREFWSEIWLSMRANKLRTALTGFAIVWGILMVILLLSVSNGFHNGVMQNFNYMNANTISIYPGWVSKPYKGMPSDRKITFNPDDINKIRKGIGTLVNVVAFSPVYNVQNAAISYKSIYATPSIIGVCPDFFKLRDMRMEKGRFINASDMESCGKVIVINENTADLLFGDDEPLGKFVTVSALLFKVVGVYSEKGGSQNSPAYIPFETSQIIFNSSRQITDLSFMVEGMDDLESIDVLKTEIRELVAGIKIFDPADEQSLWIQDRREMVGAFNILFSIINVFMWIVGLASLLAGVVGVSNIMIVTVSERTREFGIRKALGAPPSSILLSVLGESLAVTLLFGFIGMTIGIAISEAAAYYLSQNPEIVKNMIYNPTIGLDTAFSALFVLVVSGLLAGYVPARKAVKVKPIEAINAK